MAQAKVIKGQNLRLKLNNKYIAFAQDVTVHIAKQLEDSSSKDSEDGMWQEQDVVGKSFDLNASTLYAVGDDATGNTADDLTDLLINNDDPVDFEFEQTTGEKNRESTGTILWGKVIVNDGSISATNRAKGTYQLSAQGYGALHFGNGSSSNI